LRRTKIEGYLDVWNLADDAALLDPLDECVACPVVRDCEAQRILRLKDNIKNLNIKRNIPSDCEIK
jgi:hypothetical protein